jgi:GT2 family glycosyltransferase
MLTVIIPAYDLDQDRKRNLDFIYERLSSLNFKIIIAVQSKSIFDDFRYFDKFSKAEIKKINSEKYDYFNKSFIFNSCMKTVDTSFTMLLDADVYFSFQELATQIDEADEIIKPFSECIYLDEQITEEFISKKKAVASANFKRVSALGGGAIIIKTELIKQKNLWFDENFKGWGWEDIDFGDLIRFNSLNIKTLNQTAVHLYHKPSVNLHENTKYYQNKEKLKSFIVHVFNASKNNIKNIKSYINQKTKNILLMNCSDVDYLNDDNVKFSHVIKQDETYCLNKIVESAFPFLNDDGWVLFTDSNYKINEYVYSDLINFDGDFFELYGFQKDEKETFPDVNISGFAVRKKIWQEKNIPRLVIDGAYWPSIICDLFKDCKKKVLKNQIEGESFQNKKSSNINLDSLYKVFGISEKRYDITLITPTGGRPESIKNCEKFIKRNKHNLKVQWIVINDFDYTAYDFATDMIFAKNLGSSSKNPIGKSIKEAIRFIQSDFVLFIEDDDWYAPDYIQYYYDNLQKHSLFGQAFAKYYNIKNKSYEIRPNAKTASLCQTGIRTNLLLEYLSCFDDQNAPFNDLVLWGLEVNKKLDTNSDKCVGIKGATGRPGFGFGHQVLRFKDTNCNVLRSWIGEDYRLYYPDLEIKDFQDKKILTNKINEKFYNSKKVIYFSPHAPDFDMSSGGNRLLKILEILKLDLDFDVHFMCNAFKDEKHLVALKKIGIKCYTPQGQEYLIGHLNKLKKEEENFDYVIFSWYDIGSQYINIVKNIFPDIKIIVDTVDIHWKREKRGFEQGLQNSNLEALQKRKKEEIRIYEDADVVFVVTNDDKNDLIEEIGHSNIKILSNIHDQKQQILDGNDVVFIGNYLHTPNVNAAIDSIDIFNEFTKTKFYENLAIKPKLYIVGPNVTEEIKSKSNENCIIIGHVDDLDDFYKKIKVCICPLVWGSGIKGKICDSAIRGALILTSDVGNEGINLQDGKSGFIANSNDEFVKKLIFIYSNNCQSIAESGRNLVNGLVSKDAALSVLSGTLQAKPITIVIVTHNKVDDVKRCINSILENTEYPNYKIVVIDNCSTDDTPNIMKEIVKLHPEKVEYIYNEKNELFLIPNNKIILDPKYSNSDICLINNDIEIVSKCWLSYFYSAAYSEYNVCAVGGKILHPNLKLSEAGSELYSDGTGKNLGRGENPDDQKYNYPRYVGYVSGCFMYMRRDAIDKIGAFDEDFVPMYYEDSEWQYRAHLVGLKTIYEPNAVAVHHELTDELKPMKIHQENNKIKFINKYKNKNIEQYN